MDNQKERIMTYLGVSETEADEIIAYDKMVDSTNDRLEFDLDKATEKQAIKDAHKGTKETVYTFTKKERKVNEVKVELINEIAQCLEQFNTPLCENVEITNKERQIAFVCGENSYELTLVQKRKPKS